MQRKTKKILVLIVLISVSVTALSIVHYIIFNKLKSAIQQKIETLNQSDYDIQYDSIRIDWLKNRISFDSLTIEKDSPDSTCTHPEFISAGKVELEGFSLLSFLITKKISFDDIRFVDTHVGLRQNSRLLPDSASESQNEFEIAIGKLTFESAHLAYADSSCSMITALNTNIHITGLSVGAQRGKPISVVASVIRLDNTKIDLPKSFYTLLIQQSKFDSDARTAEIDTIKIIPHHSKLAFGRKTGHETDRIEGVVPFVKLAGIRFEHRDTFFLSATNTDIQMYLKIFRDKRLPDKKQFTLLPVQQLQKLSFGLSIDTIKVMKSFVEYEEFAENAENPGLVYFDNIFATIYNINNDKALPDGETIIDAQANLMGDGLLRIHSVLPWNSQSQNMMEGSIRNFSMAKINPMLFPVANMKIESGALKSLDFKYTYNMVRSAGEIELNYEDLKITSFKDDEKTKLKKGNGNGDLQKDNFKSFIVNAFIIRKNMDEGVPQEKRTGEISFERNTSRSVFNYWWKSVFSGVKSAYNIDKIQQRIVKKTLKKERRKLDKKNSSK
jgi:hypothetical protein